MLKFERERFLAEHNLRACYSELQTVKQAITDGRLWELVETRAGSHPALAKAFDTFLKYAQYMEAETPVKKTKGPFLTSEKSLTRPEIIRYQKRLLENYISPTTTRQRIILLPDKYLEPFRQNIDSDISLQTLLRDPELHLCSYNLTYGIIPNELADVYPLSQTEDYVKPTPTVLRKTTKIIAEWLQRSPYKTRVIVVEETWQRKLAESVRKRVTRSKIQILEVKPDENPTSHILAEIRKNRKRMR